jgi:ribonuclease PH
MSNKLIATKIMAWQRTDNRSPDNLRFHSFQLDFTSTPLASVLTTSGNTIVLCTASIEEGVPPFLKNSGQGWLTAEYRMLPGATAPRQRRELMKLSGRTQEIQRLIGRSLRSAIDLKLLGEKTITIDADVLQADAGTRTASITGGYVALAHGMKKLLKQGELTQFPLKESVAAISVGLLEGEAYLDLDYPEDVAADVDFNVVMNGKLELIEMQGTAEAGTFSRRQMNQMLDLAEKGITELIAAQTKVLDL